MPTSPTRHFQRGFGEERWERGGCRLGGARLLDGHAIPVWSGQVSECADFAPAIGKADGRWLAAAEILRLCSMLDRSVAAIDATWVRMGSQAQAA